MLFGRKEKICLLFQEYLGWTYTYFCQFIATMAFQSALNLSTKDLYTESTDRIVTNGLLSEIEYNKAWKQIGYQSKPKSNEVANTKMCGRIFFWKKLETVINDTYRTLFIHRYGEDNDIESQQHTDCFVIDDFKMYFTYKSSRKNGVENFTTHT